MQLIQVKKRKNKVTRIEAIFNSNSITKKLLFYLLLLKKFKNLFTF